MFGGFIIEFICLSKETNLCKLIYSILKVLNILIAIFFAVLLIQGCEEEQKKTAKIIEPGAPADSSTAIIKYNVTGTGSGKITMYKKGRLAKLELEKPVNGRNNIETRFTDGEWVYFYFMTETTLQPVKSRIIKDHNYFKNFAILSDAGEIVSKMTKTGNEIISGYTCSVYENNTGSRFSVYDGKYVLAGYFDGTIVTANEVNTSSTLKKEDVEKPAHIEFLELTAGPQ